MTTCLPMPPTYRARRSAISPAPSRARPRLAGPRRTRSGRVPFRPDERRLRATLAVSPPAAGGRPSSTVARRPRCPRAGRPGEESRLGRKADSRLGARHDDVEEQTSERHTDGERVGHLDSPPLPTEQKYLTRQRMAGRAPAAIGPVDRIRPSPLSRGTRPRL